MSVIETVRLVLEEYEIGEPWKLKKGAGFVVPILGRPPFGERNYVLLQEVEDKVVFKDSGGIGGVNVKNDSGRSVFVRKGTMLKGVGTQSRSSVAGIVLEPDAELVKIPVDCIHASHGIRTGAIFMARGVTPYRVYESLGRQSDTWADIVDYSARAVQRAGGRAARARAGGRVPDDSSVSLNFVAGGSLVDVEESVGRFRDEVDDLLKQIPGDHVNQVGMAVFDLTGVVGVEVFDHPDSWHAFSKSIIRSYGEILTEEAADLYEIKMDRAEPVLRDFLKKASDVEKKLVTENKVSRIWALTAEGVDGELAEVEGREIHLVLSKSTERRPQQTPQIISTWSMPRSTPARAAVTGTFVTENVPVSQYPTDWYRRSGSADLLQKLDKKPLRFKELLEGMDVSRGTLGSRIREAKDMGLIHRTIREENGRTVWSLTALGKEESKQLKADAG